MRTTTLCKTATTFTFIAGVWACSPGQIGDSFTTGEDRSAIIASWSLVSRDDMALTDPAVVDSAYPNIGEYDEINVSLHSDALLCGMFLREGRATTEVCGGPADGLPYFVVPAIVDETLRLKVIDIFGNEARVSEPVRNTCLFPEGRCQLCAGNTGAIERDDCGIATATAMPGTGGRPSEADGEVTESCFVQGAQAFIDFANQSLQDVEMPVWTVRAEELARPISMPDDPNRVVISVGVPRAMQPVDNICDTYGAGEVRIDGSTPLREDYLWAANTVRCGFLANDALVSGCSAPTPACAAAERYDYELGLLAAHNAWIGGDLRNWGYTQRADNGCGYENPDCESPAPGPECVGSPLVMSFDEAPVKLLPVESGVRFDLLGTGHAVQTGWVGHGAFLALDRNFNGRIDSGRELFGEATRLTSGELAYDGFRALAEFDDARLGGNGDGRIDAKDAVFPSLRLWHDVDTNGRSAPTELRALADTGIVSVRLDRRRVSETAIDAAGNSVALKSSALRRDGSATPVYDIWFRYYPVGRATSFVSSLPSMRAPVAR